VFFWLDDGCCAVCRRRFVACFGTPPHNIAGCLSINSDESRRWRPPQGSNVVRFATPANSYHKETLPCDSTKKIEKPNFLLLCLSLAVVGRRGHVATARRLGGGWRRSFIMRSQLWLCLSRSCFLSPSASLPSRPVFCGEPCPEGAAVSSISGAHVGIGGVEIE
jgi:hypothetical protein